jgi:hypothetical protein
MIRDLRTILDGWDYEQGKISVRKIIGRDGREKVQTRIDLGVLQIELDGRPDGRQPHGCESLLDHFEQRLLQHLTLYGDDDEFVLTAEDCQELRHEAYLYYQRYLSLFVLEDYERVIRDTARNLRVIDLCTQFYAGPEEHSALEAQRPYVMMMNARARACLALQEEDHEGALAAVDAGVAALRDLALDDDTHDPSTEIRVLLDLRQEVLNKMPSEAPSKLQHELAAAVANEDYERAAELRDRLAALNPGSNPPAGRPAAPTL